MKELVEKGFVIVIRKDYQEVIRIKKSKDGYEVCVHNEIWLDYESYPEALIKGVLEAKW